MNSDVDSSSDDTTSNNRRPSSDINGQESLTNNNNTNNNLAHFGINEFQDLSFGDFNQDELNIYLINKKLNKTTSLNQHQYSTVIDIDNLRTTATNNKNDEKKFDYFELDNRINLVKSDRNTNNNTNNNNNELVVDDTPRANKINYSNAIDESSNGNNIVVNHQCSNSFDKHLCNNSSVAQQSISSDGHDQSAVASPLTPSTNTSASAEFDIEFGFDLQNLTSTLLNTNARQTNAKSTTTSCCGLDHHHHHHNPHKQHPSSSSFTSSSSSSSSTSSSPPHSPLANKFQTKSTTMEEVVNKSNHHHNNFVVGGGGGGGGHNNHGHGHVNNHNHINHSPHDLTNGQSESQRRNKKKKPPNYYQSAEYAAIIKLNEQQADAAAAAAAAASNNSTIINNNNNNNNNTNTNNSSSNDSELTTTTSNKIEENILPNNTSNNINNDSHVIESSIQPNLVSSKLSDNKLDNIASPDSITTTTTTKPQTACEPMATPTHSLTNGDSDHSSSTSSASSLAHSLEKVNIDDQKSESSAANNSVTSTTPSTTAVQNNSNTSKPAPWSSLFKNQQQQQQQSQQSVNSAKTQKQSTTPSISSSKQTNSTNQNGGVNHSHSSSENHSSQSTSSNEVLKNLGTLFKQCELKHSAPALQPRGLSNRNNWCYVNATLQALLACPPFYNLLKTVYSKLKSGNSTNMALTVQQVPFVTAMGRFISEFKVMVRHNSSTSSQSDQSKSSSNKELLMGDSFECEYLYDVLKNSQTQMEFKQGRQEDAQEFLSFLLNRLHEEMIKCLDSLNLKPEQQQHEQQNHQPQQTVNSADYSKLNGKGGLNGHNGSEATNNGTNEEDDDEWKEVGRKNKAFVTRKPEFKQSPLSDIFCGQFRSALSQPGVKDKESVSLEPFFTLPLEIQSDSIRTVQQAMEHFVQKEELSGFIHQETKQEIEAFKRISFEDLPPVLIIYLKCFVFDKQGGSQKLLKRLEFQIDLEISRELISSNQRSKLKEKKRAYKLFAVEYHYGERATGGHYITDVYHPGIVGWVRYDDASVRVVNNAQVLKSEDRKLIPYLLYYRRCDLI